MKKVSKKVLILLFCVMIFLVINVLWYVLIYTPYHNLEKVLDYDANKKEYIYVDSDGCSYSVGTPYYLGTTGNLAITEKLIVRDDKLLTDSTVNLIIWPNLNGEYDYGVDIRLHEFKDGKMYTDSYQINLDNSRNPIDFLDDKTKEVFDSHTEKIELMYEKADDMWGIFSEKS